MSESPSPCRGIVIAIDGPSGAGKSTTAKAVAARLGYDYLDTGAMYRAITLAAMRAGVAAKEDDAMRKLLASFRLEIHTRDEGTQVILDGDDVSEEIRRQDVTAAVSAYSALPLLRRVLVERQCQIGEFGGVVVEGRDIGTVVFPNAELKIFLEASLAERARRRKRDLDRAGHAATDREVETDLARRDHADSSRSASPLAPASDAIHLDNSALSFDEQVAEIVRLARQRGA